MHAHPVTCTSGLGLNTDQVLAGSWDGTLAWGLSVHLPNNRVRVGATLYIPVPDSPPSSLSTPVPI